jgi:hypothetical protein
MGESLTQKRTRLSEKNAWTTMDSWPRPSKQTMRLLMQAVAWLACSLYWADEIADDGAVAALSGEVLQLSCRRCGSHRWDQRQSQCQRAPRD